jgi:isopenicillin N synthase-like dioxygenase
MLYYPRRTDLASSENDVEDLRAGAHSDFGSITCLFQLPGQPGLEILTPEGEWAGVAVDPFGITTATATATATARDGGKRNLPILVNIGDLLQEWTGGLLKSTRHRVVFPHYRKKQPGGGGDDENGSSSSNGSGGSGDRYSLAYFCHPCDDAVLEPVPSRLVREHISSNAGIAAAGQVEGGEERSITAKDHLQRRLMETYTIST